MKSLLLSGYGIKMNVDKSKLHIKNGLDRHRNEVQEYIYKLKFIDLDHVILYGHSSNISLDSIKWLMKQNIPVSVLDWNGRLWSAPQARLDNIELRNKILNISYSERKKIGYSKGSLHYLKKNAKSNKPFKIYGKMRDKLINIKII